MTPIEKQGAAAKIAAGFLMSCSTGDKNKALLVIAERICDSTRQILQANQEDLEQARAAGMRQTMLDRLALTEQRIAGIADGVRQVAALEDPIGKVERMDVRPNGLVIGRKRVTLGVIAMIYEARPNVTVDAAVLCLKSGNAVILRGGKEAYRTNACLTEIMRGALRDSGLPKDCVALLSDTSRESARELMELTA